MTATQHLELARTAADGKSIHPLAVLHITNLEEANQFQSRLCAVLACPLSMLKVELTIGLSVHGGQGWHHTLQGL